MSIRKKKVLLVFMCFLLLIFTYLLTLLIVSRFGSDSNFEYLEQLNIQPIGADKPAFEYNEDIGCFEFVMEEGKEFKILQLTDTHLGGGILTEKKDKQVIDAIYKMVKHADPDLIILTGDILYPFSFQTANLNTSKVLDQFAVLMEAMQVPWAPVLGNHDTPAFGNMTREEISVFFESDELEYCVYNTNPDNTEISGYGNYIININNPDGTINNSLVILDTHTSTKGIQLDQIEWYEDSLRELSTIENGQVGGQLVQSLVFFHIPLYEYKLVWDKYEAGDKDVQYLFGVQDERVLSPKADQDKFFDAMVELGSTKATFCGHNHMNNYAIIYKDIQLTFGNSLVYTGLNGIANKDDYRGGTLIEISNDRTFETIPIFLKDIA